MPWETTTLWEGYGLEVQRQVMSNAAVTQIAPNTSTIKDIVEIRLIQQPGEHFHTLGDIARVFSEEQIKKIAASPERWARSIISQRLRSARNRALRCHNALEAATQSVDRWAELAGRLGIQR